MMASVRRAAPWLLVGVVMLGAGLGMGLGLAMQPVASANGHAFLARVLATTRRAGSARFTFTANTRSSNRFLRSSASGFGVIDFATNASEVTTITQSMGLGSSNSGPLHPPSSTDITEELTLGGVRYIRLSTPGALPLGAPAYLWIKLPAPRGAGNDVLTSVLDTEVPYALLSSMPNLEVREVGPSSIGTVPATEYSFTPSCVVPAVAGKVRTSSSPLDVWVDGAGRLVQARGSMSVTTPRGSLPAALGSQLIGTSITVTSLRLHDFGTSVRLMAPQPDARSASVSTTIGILAGQSGKCI
jgi:hypothetical protein